MEKKLSTAICIFIIIAIVVGICSYYFASIASEQDVQGMENVTGKTLSDSRYNEVFLLTNIYTCLLYTSPSPRDRQKSRMPSSA